MTKRLGGNLLFSSSSNHSYQQKYMEYYSVINPSSKHE